MAANGINEVIHVNTCETSIEIGSPTGGRVKFPLTAEEIADEEKAMNKIDSLSRILKAAQSRLGGGKKSKPAAAEE